jgi:hypothetical protein
MAVREDANNYLERSTINILTHYMGDMGAAIAARLAEINGEMPPVTSDPTEEAAPPRLQPPEKQMSWGITRRNGKFAVAILTEQRNSEANRKAERIERDYRGYVVRRITARAHSFDPTGRGHTYKPVVRHRTPGASIGHVSGYPGTIACFARSTVVGENWIGVISASHVLGRNNKSKPGDAIMSPGHPDAPKSSKHHIGALDRFIMLTSFEEDVPGDNYLCCQDVALVKLTEKSKDPFPDATLVCCPNNPQKLMPIKEVIGGDKVAERLGEPVYKVGRTTGLTQGSLEIVGLQRQSIRIAEQHYVYTNVLAVASKGKEPFSKAGDSGALVYTKDGCAIGLVIAGTDQVSYLSPLDACLRDIEADLLQ